MNALVSELQDVSIVDFLNNGDGRTVSFYEREAKNYRRITYSRALLQLPAEKLAEFLEMSRIQGQTSAPESFRAWLRTEIK